MPESSHPNTSNITHLSFGTGHSIYTSRILPAISQAKHSVILVTCFWAPSPTLSALHTTLLALSARAVALNTIIRVRIGLSSYNLPHQLLFHTSAPTGRLWTATECRDQLGLPDASAIPGLDLQVKSVFVRPLSVWHPKFVIIDGQHVLLPSCNVSWEEWLEGCVEMKGPIVQDFELFWRRHWARGREQHDTSPSDADLIPQDQSPSTPSLLQSHPLTLPSLPTLLLPSPHHRNPNFHPFPWQSPPPAPPTPLNTHLLHLFSTARSHIHLQTPNLTSPPVLTALLAALDRGVHVSVSTCEDLMVFEQLVTAGTTTARCIARLVRAYQQRQRNRVRAREADIEAQAGLLNGLGRLRVQVFASRKGDEGFAARGEQGGVVSEGEPVQAHVKLTLVDDETVVFGSGNMDRASWFTSQELGLAVRSRELARVTREGLEKVLERRTRVVYDSGSTEGSGGE